MNGKTTGSYSISLIGSKSLIPRNREAFKLFYSNIDSSTYEINGTKFGLSDGMCVMPNSELYRMSNEVIFSNLWEYYHEGHN